MSESVETAILAGGCAWPMQQLLRHPGGVISTRVGWTGGEGDNPTEENPQGHVEAVEVVFDPERLSYRELLEYFFQVHRADLGEDQVGSIYRSQVFYTSEEQRRVAFRTTRRGARRRSRAPGCMPPTATARPNSAGADRAR